jgi:hypothetical protein
MSYHALLDWRLGVSVLKCLANVNYHAGLDGKFSSPELLGWLDFSRKHRDSICASYVNESPAPKQWGELYGIDIGRYRLILVHELWDYKNPVSGTILHVSIEAANRDRDNRELRFVNPFNLVRRPSWVVGNLQV